jgi:hypothetical protein
MKNSPNESLKSDTHFRAVPIRLTAWLAALVILSPGATTLRAQTINDNFNDQTDSGAQGTWTHYDLGYWTSLLSGGAISYGTAHFSFPANPAGPTGNYAYRIQADPTGEDPAQIGPARAASFRADAQYGGSPYSIRFQAGVDLVNWNPVTLNQDVGMLFMIQPATIMPGQTAGYALTYQSSDSTLYLSSVNSESAHTVGEQSVALNPAHQYRMVVSTHDGFTFLGTVFDLAEPNSPVASAISQDTTYQGIPGYCGLLVNQEDHPSPNGVDATFDNYSSTAPAAGTMPATITDLSPPPGGKASDIYPAVTVGILNRDTEVDTSSVVLWMDGVAIPNGALTIDNQVYKPDNPTANGRAFPGATVTYSNGVLYAWGSKHTNVVVFKDSANVWQTNTWSWTSGYPFLFATNSLPMGSLTVRGFNARMVQSYNPGDPAYANIGATGGLPNGVDSAQALLAIPPRYTMNETATSIVQLVAWDINPANFHYGAVTNFPGMCLPPGNVNSFAVETVAYLQLTAGAHRFYVDSDDAVAVYSGANLMDTSTVLVLNNGVTHTAFDFLVEADGLYPFHIVFEQGGGDAYLVLKSVNLSDGSQTLVNAPGGVNAFYSAPEWACMTSSSATGPYTALTVPIDPSVTTTPVSCDGTGEALNLSATVTGGTITIPNITNSAQFYRVVGPRSSRITSAKKVGANLVITFQTP